MPPIWVARDREGGFTLLEVLIAFAIVSGLMAAVLTLHRDTGRTAQAAEVRSATIEAARSTLARVGPELPLAEGVTSHADGPVRIELRMAPGALPRLWEVSATARWDGAEITLDTLKRGPPVP